MDPRDTAFGPHRIDPRLHTSVKKTDKNWAKNVTVWSQTRENWTRNWSEAKGLIWRRNRGKFWTRSGPMAMPFAPQTGGNRNLPMSKCIAFGPK